MSDVQDTLDRVRNAINSAYEALNKQDLKADVYLNIMKELYESKAYEIEGRQTFQWLYGALNVRYSAMVQVAVARALSSTEMTHGIGKRREPTSSL